jgi:hypothetical protein
LPPDPGLLHFCWGTHHHGAPTSSGHIAPGVDHNGCPNHDEVLESLGGELCPESDFTCVTLEMPLDHFDPSNDDTIDVVLVGLPATGETSGAFLTVTGGPGSSGIASADSYTSLYDPAIAEKYDIVFFDPRGIAASGGPTCPTAATAYFRAEGDVYSASGINRLVEAARWNASEHRDV